MSGPGERVGLIEQGGEIDPAPPTDTAVDVTQDTEVVEAIAIDVTGGNQAKW